MAVSVRITEAELLDALTSASEAPADAMTAVELCAATGISNLLLKRALKRLASDGRLLSHRVKRTRIDGMVTSVPAYTILPAKK